MIKCPECKRMTARKDLYSNEARCYSEKCSQKGVVFTVDKKDIEIPPSISKFDTLLEALRILSNERIGAQSQWDSFNFLIGNKTVTINKNRIEDIETKNIEDIKVLAQEIIFRSEYPIYEKLMSHHINYVQEFKKVCTELEETKAELEKYKTKYEALKEVMISIGKD